MDRGEHDLVLRCIRVELGHDTAGAHHEDAVRDEGVRIVDAGVVAPEEEPEFPKPVINLLLGFILALALGVSAALVREVW